MYFGKLSTQQFGLLGLVLLKMCLMLRAQFVWHYLQQITRIPKHKAVIFRIANIYFIWHLYTESSWRNFQKLQATVFETDKELQLSNIWVFSRVLNQVRCGFWSVWNLLHATASSAFFGDSNQIRDQEPRACDAGRRQARYEKGWTGLDRWGAYWHEVPFCNQYLKTFC